MLAWAKYSCFVDLRSLSPDDDEGGMIDGFDLIEMHV